VACTVNVLRCVIYDRNGSGLYYNTTIVTNLALASIINFYLWVIIYYLKVGMLQTEAYLTIVIYDRKTSILQATVPVI
jgi:hypothetical protein